MSPLSGERGAGGPRPIVEFLAEQILPAPIERMLHAPVFVARRRRGAGLQSDLIVHQISH